MSRIGISVGKKLGNAVKRNRLRRRLRDCIGRALGQTAPGYDLVFVARPELGSRDFPQILAAVTRILQRAKLTGAAPEGSKQ